MRKAKYKAISGKEYNVRIIKTYDGFVDMELIEEDQETTMLKVRNSMISYEK